ncbi:MAG: DUF1080 domain-containing protein [Novosphingobium sp.]
MRRAVRFAGILAVAASAAAAVAVAAAAGGEALFNGRDFAGWTFFLEHKEYNAAGQGKIADFATVKPGGVIEIAPRMHGALMTTRDYLDYDLHAEYRFVDPKADNDSGIFLRIRPPFVWDSEHGELARFYMLQIQPGNTGDLWVMGYSESMLKSEPARSFKPFGELELGKGGHIRRHLKLRDAERTTGDWNTIDLSLTGKTIEVYLNGALVNEARALVDLPGRIGLESERGAIQFRNIRLEPRLDQVSDEAQVGHGPG